MLEQLFSEKQIGSCTIPNRLVVPAMVTNYCTADGQITERYLRYIEEKAKGGWGLIITEDYAVTPDGKGYQRIPGLYDDAQIPGNRELTETVHQYDSKIFCQMYHPGKQTTRIANGDVTPVAPSAIKDPMCLTQPREITLEEIKALVTAFGNAARRCKEAGFDGIELHCAHGYLLAEFLSAFVNKRTDAYGGCFDNRVRIVDEIYAAMRAAVGPDFPLMVRISGNEYVPGGRTEAETYELALHLEALGFDAIHVSNGAYASHPLRQIIAPMFTDHALNMDTAEAVRKLVKIPVVVTNRINDPKMAETLLRMGKCDFVGMARGSLADPYLPQKAKDGRFENIHYCIGCLQGCEWPILENGCVTCLVNPAVGREYERPYKPAEKAKTVMVIGGGPAGLVAAQTAAKRGHAVTVYEAAHMLGGQFRSAAYPMGKGELTTFIASLRKSLEDLQVPIVLNTEVTEALLAKVKPDVVIVATGAKPLMPAIAGIDGANVVTAESVLLGESEPADGPVVVCGGGEVGGETAEFIAQTQKDVTVLEMQEAILNDMMPLTRVCLLESLEANHVKVVTGAKVQRIDAGGVTYQDANGREQTVPAATVVSAFGYRAHHPLADVAGQYAPEVYTIGSAVQAGNAIAAGKEGLEIGMRI